MSKSDRWFDDPKLLAAIKIIRNATAPNEAVDDDWDSDDEVSVKNDRN